MIKSLKAERTSILGSNAFFPRDATMSKTLSKEVYCTIDNSGSMPLFTFLSNGYDKCCIRRQPDDGDFYLTTPIGDSLNLGIDLVKKGPAIPPNAIFFHFFFSFSFELISGLQVFTINSQSRTFIIDLKPEFEAVRQNSSIGFIWIGN